MGEKVSVRMEIKSPARHTVPYGDYGDYCSSFPCGCRPKGRSWLKR